MILSCRRTRRILSLALIGWLALPLGIAFAQGAPAKAAKKAPAKAAPGKPAPQKKSTAPAAKTKPAPSASPSASGAKPETPTGGATTPATGTSATPGSGTPGGSAAAKPTDATTPDKPEDEKAAGKTVDLSEAFKDEEEKPYTYQPADPIFWAKIMSQLSDKNQVAVVIEAAKQEDSMGSSTPEGGEAQLAMAIGLMEKRLYFAAFHILTNLVQDRIGTSVGEGALYHLSRLTQDSFFDEQALIQLLSRNEFSTLHPEVESFVSYYKGIELLQLGFTEWAKVHLDRIKKDSYWDYLYKYWTAVGELVRNRPENATKLFQNLLEVPNLHPKLFEKVALQYARLVFEQGDFITASAIYNNLGLTGVREIGRINLERAWVLYYMKDYAKAMGVLTSLQSPYFEPSLTYERHILEMIIYRELCHYKAVESVAQRFRFDFNDSLKTIRKRNPLRHEKKLFNMAVLDLDVQNTANLIEQMRREKQMLAEYNWGQFSFYKIILDEYSRMDNILQARVDIELEEKARYAANELLDAEEQVLFLEYTSRLDELRVRRGDDRTYKAEDISYLTFEKIYWPADGEFWWDEMPDYKMLISSRCGDMTSPDEDQLEKEFQ
ncbi:MAG: hypothetical protein IT288_05330 [Bdellovibrionales bacterium]|nr:hypothetical protein [Bdellovibrionales bacterium]